jgi:hypothetical protein
VAAPDLVDEVVLAHGFFGVGRLCGLFLDEDVRCVCGLDALSLWIWMQKRRGRRNSRRVGMTKGFLVGLVLSKVDETISRFNCSLVAWCFDAEYDVRRRSGGRSSGGRSSGRRRCGSRVVEADVGEDVVVEEVVEDDVVEEE